VDVIEEPYNKDAYPLALYWKKKSIYICSCFDEERPQSVWEPGEDGQGARNFVLQSHSVVQLSEKLSNSSGIKSY